MSNPNDKGDIHTRSGEVTTEDTLVAFLYLLLRDHVLPGDIETLMRNIAPHDRCLFSNGWLAQYAKDIAERLRQ